MKIEIPLASPVLRTRQGMAVHKHNQTLLAYLNQWIKNNRTSGWLGQITDYWFSSLGWHRKR